MIDFVAMPSETDPPDFADLIRFAKQGAPPLQPCDECERLARAVADLEAEQRAEAGE